MKLFIRVLFTMFLAAGLMPRPCHGQTDSVKSYKNTIRYNITNPVLFSWKFNVVGYERVLSDYQSIAVNVGRTALEGFLLSNDSIDLIDQYNDKGFNFSVDYRFYLQKENKYRAPRGVYIGPYYSYNQFARDLTWDLNTENFDGEVNAGFNIHAHFIGAQLGYQFVFWDRVALDMILLGPGLWFWKMDSSFDTSLGSEDETMLLEILNGMLEERFPGSSLVLGEGFEAQKTTTSYTMGLRYMINIGFRF